MQPYDELPCHYLLSINITGGTQHDDGSITFENITYSSSLYGKMDRVLRYDENHVPFFEEVEPYKRGCICNITKCLHASYVDDGNSKWGDDALRYKENEKELISFDYKFIYENPCAIAYEAEPNEVQITDVSAKIFFVQICD